jgi:hypothetical protein
MATGVEEQGRPGALRGFFARLLGLVRRASDRVRRVVVTGLLYALYVVAMPWFAIALRLGGPRAGGWRRRDDAAVATLERLRRAF